MRPVITPAESSRLDGVTSIPEAVLLERAGLAVALSAARMGARYGTRVVVLAGTGNNGGDGWVAARHLRRRGVDVVVRCLGYPKGDTSARRLAAIAAIHEGVPVTDLGAPEPADLVVDALFGSGFHGTLPDRVAAWTEHPAPVLAVDLPSGLDGTVGTVHGPVFRAARTVTFHALKTGQLIGVGPDVCGEIEVADIGLSGEEAEWSLCEDSDAWVPMRPRTAHKWSAGAVAVIGGSPGIAGAAVLAARSALSFGAGSVRVIAPGGVAGTVAAMDPGLTTAGVGPEDRFGPDAVAGVLAAVERFDVLALGPGLGSTTGFVPALLERWPGPVVLDADGLAAVTVADLASRRGPTVVTPHAAEFARLAGEPASAPAAASLAARTGAVVLLKGAPTFVMGTERWVVDSGSAALATIGTGDVLTGMVGALMARGMPPEAAARAAAHRHGRAGRALEAVTTVTASGLVAAIGRWAW
ncbi:MAG TPA: bifunctional ADP-dependent NAD(P)H-hydrate dehydratase/NAD(P)H-hydrate epimerase [Actinobacteria bacterium]|nr:bifunctional ADP-dependent NAD(P)H-hydrate dehydratase/NAD(P)H-hydrate epimerase [Actinomycetota bacterium]